MSVGRVRYSDCMSEQIAVRIPDELADELRQFVAAGAHPTMADAVRAGIRLEVARLRRRAVDDSIVDGYRRTPPTDAETAWADAAGREMIAEEPW